MRLFLSLLPLLAPRVISAAIVSVFVGLDENGSLARVIRPQVINAQVGDIVEFQFRGGNHTITQSSFSAPCTQIFNTATQKKGIDSGFIKYDPNSGNIGVFSLTITQVDTPIWLFCAQPGHCKGGMVAAINPKQTGDKTFAAFQAQLTDATEPGYGVTTNFTPAAGPTRDPSGGASRLQTSIPMMLAAFIFVLL